MPARAACCAAVTWPAEADDQGSATSAVLDAVPVPEDALPFVAVALLAMLCWLAARLASTSARRQRTAGSSPPQRDPADLPTAHPPDADVLRRYLVEARAQYEVHPSDYLEGVITGLLAVLDNDASLEPVRRLDDQHRHAAGRNPTDRMRDYYQGKIAVFTWALGDTTSPPVKIVMTAPTRALRRGRRHH